MWYHKAGAPDRNENTTLIDATTSIALWFLTVEATWLAVSHTVALKEVSSGLAHNSSSL